MDFQSMGDDKVATNIQVRECFSGDDASFRAVPELSLGSYTEGSQLDKVKFIDNLYEGLIDYGFIILDDHPLKMKQIDDSYQQVMNFFSLPEDIKKGYQSLNGGQRGYTPYLEEHAKNSLYPDLKEFWHVGRELPKGHRFENIYNPNLWPSEIPLFKKILLDLFGTMDQMSHTLLEALGQALDLAPGTFDRMIEGGNSILRAIHYPPVEGAGTKGSIRAAEHEDINLITMLVGATDSGLQLKDRDGTWLSVNSQSDQIVVDSGDMLSRLTNDIIPATTHRVVNPDNDKSPRFSMPFFVHPNPDAILKCLPSCIGKGEKYPEIRANDFLLQRLKEIGLLK